MLHVEGGEIVRFFSCGGVGHVEGGGDSPFLSCGEGREKRLDSKGKSYQPERDIGAYQDEDSIRLIGAGFPANTFTTERALYQYFSIIL